MGTNIQWRLHNHTNRTEKKITRNTALRTRRINEDARGIQDILVAEHVQRNRGQNQKLRSLHGFG